MIFTSCSSDDNEVFVGDNFFTDRQAIIDEINALKKGQTVQLTGEVVYDSYGKCDSFMISKLEVIPEKKG